LRLAVTWHRPGRIVGHEKEIYEWFIKKFKEIRPSEVITGMAQGVDQIAAQAAKDLGINYICVYPYRKKLTTAEQELVDSCSLLVWLSGKYYYNCYLVRDEIVVDRSEGVLAVWDGEPGGGTYYTMNYAKEKGKLLEVYRV